MSTYLQLVGNIPVQKICSDSILVVACGWGACRGASKRDFKHHQETFGGMDMLTIVIVIMVFTGVYMSKHEICTLIMCNLLYFNYTSIKQF